MGGLERGLVWGGECVGCEEEGERVAGRGCELGGCEREGVGGGVAGVGGRGEW